jgi:two-component system, OmpR family, sensor kinase
VTRHFLGLYALIVLTLAVASWGQEKLLQTYDAQEFADEPALNIALSLVAAELLRAPVSEWNRIIAQDAHATGGAVELFATSDIAGRETLDRLKRGQIAYMQASATESWSLKQLNRDYVLALKSATAGTQRGPLDWMIMVLFYGVIALVVMIWLWPLTRDLRALEAAAARFGDRNWRFEVRIRPGSQIYALSETFRKMAARIDGLIASHKDMSNAVSHEIKTPLSRMQFEIELAQRAKDVAEVSRCLRNIKSDIVTLNDLVNATLSYAILERADMSLNSGAHNFATLIPAITEYVQRDARPEIAMDAQIHGSADQVICDAHLMETAVKNLLYNAARHARQRVHITFTVLDGANELLVDDDGPGIAPQDRQRVFNSFVQLENAGVAKRGFGLGLAIVKRIIEWHGGEVTIAQSPLGGARFRVIWPAIPPSA